MRMSTSSKHKEETILQITQGWVETMDGIEMREGETMIENGVIVTLLGRFERGRNICMFLP